MVIIKLTNTTKSSWVRVVGMEHHSRLVSILQLSGRTLPSSLLVPVAKVQITYDLPSTLFQKTWLKGLSAYVSGANLLTISGEREVLEMNVGSAPQTRYYNIGVKATF